MKLSGTIPRQLAYLQKLTHLKIYASVHHNTRQRLLISGTLPDNFGNMTALKTLELMDAKVSGTFPADIRKLTNLVTWRVIKMGRLSGHCLPSELGSLEKLERIDAYMNGNLGGTIPTEIGRLQRLKTLFMSQCCNYNGGGYTTKISGTIPSEVGNLVSLETIRFYNTAKLSGKLPHEFGNMVNMRILELHGSKKVSGTLPAGIANWQRVGYFNMEESWQLSGRLPEKLGNMTALGGSGFTLSAKISGTIPPGIGNLQNVGVLDLGSSKLSGTIPIEITRLLKLKKLRLNGVTKISGLVPFGMQNLVKLDELDLRSMRNLTAPPCPLGSTSDQSVFPAKCLSCTGYCWSEDICSNGTYRAVPGPCILCGPGKYSTEGRGQTAESVCISCGAGKYATAGAGQDSPTVCIACPGGTYSISGTAQTAAAICVSCAPGKYSTAGRGQTAESVCISCGGGTYSIAGAAKTNATVCIACRQGTYSLAGTAQTSPSVCIDCVAGKYATAGAGQVSPLACIACSKGKYGSAVAARACISCDQGRYSLGTGQTAASVCIACGAGRYSSAGPAQSSVAVCIPCEVGTRGKPGRVAQTGASSCESCGLIEKGYQDESGQLTCKVCTGFGVPTGDFIGCGCASSCPAGTFTKEDANGDQSCVPCPAGTQNKHPGRVGERSCLKCSHGRFQEKSGKARCDSCAAGKYGSGAAPGATSEGDACTACSPGKYSTAGTAQKSEAVCIACAPGKFSESGEAQTSKEVCVDCAAGKYSTSGEAAQTSSVCVDCREGRYGRAKGAIAETACRLCGSGQYGDQVARSSEGSCKACRAGTSSSAEGQNSTTACVPCAKGWFQAAKGAASCVPCPKGKFSTATGLDSGETCFACSSGKYGSAHGASEAAQCTDCPPGRFGAREAATTAADCTACRPGRSNAKGGQAVSGACQDCPAGRFQFQAAAAACLPCSPGHYGTAAGQSKEADACRPCPSGRYSSAAALDSKEQCSECQIGRHGIKNGTTTPATGCRDCVAGKKGVRSGGATEAEGCTLCAAGSEYQDEKGKASCKPMAFCPLGKYNDRATASSLTEMRLVCRDCPPGRYGVAPGLGSIAECTACPQGRFGSLVGSESGSLDDTCTRCPVGKRGRVSGQSTESSGCRLCQAGTEYQDEAGQVACKVVICPAGTFVLQAKANSTAHAPCEACEPGTYQPLNGAAVKSCQLCPKGRAQPGRSAQACNSCPVLETTLGPGRTRCVCEKEYYRDGGDGNGTCVRCPLALDCDVEGGTLRQLRLKPGKWRPDPNSKRFYDCPDGEEVCVGSKKQNQTTTGGKNDTLGRRRLQQEQARRITSANNLTHDQKPSAGTGNISDISSVLVSSDGDALCITGHGGLLCATCDDGWYRMRTRGRCASCEGSRSSALGIAAAVVVVVVLVAAILFDLYIRDRIRMCRRPKKIGGEGSGQSNGRLRIIISFTQQISILLMFPAKWPAEMLRFKEFISVWMIDVSIVAPSCLGVPMDFYSRLGLTAIATLLISLGPWLLLLIKSTVYATATGCSSARTLTWWQRWKHSWLVGLEATIFYSVTAVLFIHPAVSGQGFFFFACRPIELLESDNVTRTTRYFLTADYSLECYSTTWFRVLPLAVVVVGGFALGVPLAFLYLLYRKRHEIEKSGVKRLKHVAHLKRLRQRLPSKKKNKNAQVDVDEGKHAHHHGATKPRFTRSSSNRRNAAHRVPTREELEAKYKSEADTIAIMLGVLHSIYKPGVFKYFEIFNFQHKLLLWGGLVFLGYGSSLQMGFALVLCSLKLLLHFSYMPLLADMDNYLEVSISAVTALLGIGGILLKSIGGQKEIANLRNNEIALQQAEEAQRWLGYGMNVTLFLVVSLAGIAFLQLFVDRIEPLGRRCTAFIQRANSFCCKSRSSTKPQVPNEERYLEVFTEFDKDQSGSIDGDELLDVLRELGHASATKEQAAEMFATMDTDGNGVVDYEEFIVMAEALDLGTKWSKHPGSSSRRSSRNRGRSLLGKPQDEDAKRPQGRNSSARLAISTRVGDTEMVANPMHNRSTKRETTALASPQHPLPDREPQQELQVVEQKRHVDEQDDLEGDSSSQTSYDMSDLLEWQPSPRLPGTPRSLPN